MTITRRVTNCCKFSRIILKLDLPRSDQIVASLAWHSIDNQAADLQIAGKAVSRKSPDPKIKSFGFVYLN